MKDEENTLKDFDLFWLEKGRDLVNNTVDNLYKHLANYSKYLTYLNGFYIAGGLSLEAFYQSTNLYVFLSFIIPVILIYIASFMISVGQTVQLETLDLRSPLSINEAHGKLITGIKKDIMRAKLWVFIATIAVLMGGSIAIHYLNKDNKEKIDDERALIIEEKLINDTVTKQKFEITKTKDKAIFTLKARVLIDTECKLEIININNETIPRTIVIPKHIEFKYEMNNVCEVLNVELIKIEKLEK